MENILLNFATRGRPKRFKEALDSIFANAKEIESLMILVKLDNDDNMLNEYQQVLNKYEKQYPLQHSRIRTTIGYSKNKIDAINRDLSTFVFLNDWHFDIIITFSDDMVFVFENWDMVVRKVFNTFFPKMDGFPVFKDFYRKDTLPVMDVQGVNYYKRFNYIYHPDYVSLYCDNENLEVAKLLDKFVFIDKPLIFEHKHPNNIPTIERDLRYHLTESYYRPDEITFNKRKANNFGLAKK